MLPLVLCYWYRSVIPASTFLRLSRSASLGRSRAHHAAGNGQGLAIAARMVQQHGSTIDVAGTVGVDPTVRLPAVSAPNHVNCGRWKAAIGRR